MAGALAGQVRATALAPALRALPGPGGAAAWAVRDRARALASVRSWRPSRFLLRPPGRALPRRRIHRPWPRRPAHPQPGLLDARRRGLNGRRLGGGPAHAEHLPPPRHHGDGAAASALAGAQCADVALAQRDARLRFAALFAALPFPDEHQQLHLLPVGEHVFVALVGQAGLADEAAQMIRRQLERLRQLFDRDVNHRRLRPWPAPRRLRRRFPSWRRHLLPRLARLPRTTGRAPS